MSKRYRTTEISHCVLSCRANATTRREKPRRRGRQTKRVTNHTPPSHLGNPPSPPFRRTVAPLNLNSRASLGLPWPLLASLGLSWPSVWPRRLPPGFLVLGPTLRVPPSPPEIRCLPCRRFFLCPDHNGTMELQLRTPRPKAAGERLGGCWSRTSSFCAVVSSLLRWAESLMLRPSCAA